MKTTPEPTERDLTLGTPIRPATPAKPDPVKPFEAGDWLPKGLKEKPAEPAAPADPIDVMNI